MRVSIGRIALFLMIVMTTSILFACSSAPSGNSPSTAISTTTVAQAGSPPGTVDPSVVDSKEVTFTSQGFTIKVYFSRLKALSLTMHGS